MSPSIDIPSGTQTLRDEYERLALSFKAFGGGLWDYDIEADHLYCNDRWYEILGLDPLVSPISSIAEFKPHIHPDDVDMATRVDQAPALLAQDESYQIEFRIVRPSGEVRRLRSVACLVEDRSSRHMRAIGCVTDVTDFQDGHLVSQSASSGPMAAELRLTPKRAVTAEARSDGRSLTSRERECLFWVSVGKTAWETATILGRSRRTVEFHLKNATRKLDASNKVHAAATAIRLNLF